MLQQSTSGFHKGHTCSQQATSCVKQNGYAAYVMTEYGSGSKGATPLLLQFLFHD